MKNILILVTFTTLNFSSFVQAAPPDLDLMKAVVNNPTIEAIVQEHVSQGELVGVEKAQTFRCPGCFEYTLKFKTIVGTEYRNAEVRLAVRVSSKGEVEVTEIRPSL